MAVNFEPIHIFLMLKPLQLVGIVGHPLTGKDAAAEYLKNAFDFTFVSTGDYIRSYITSHGLGDTSLANLNRVSTELRRQFGPAFPIPNILEENEAEFLVIAGPRVVAEAEALKDNGAFIVAIEAPQHIRYERTKARKRLGDDVTFERFVEFERLESENPDPCAHNVSRVIAMADFHINNDGSLEDLHRTMFAVLKQMDLKTMLV